jgi:tetratricopeptide (TPR) repeat protein
VQAQDPSHSILRLCLITAFCLLAPAGAARAGAAMPAPAPGAADCAGAAGRDLDRPADSAQACYAQALCLRRMGRLRDAAARVERALGLAPGLAPALRLRRELQAQLRDDGCKALCASADQDRALGRLEQAERGYQLALRLDPDCAAAWDGLAALGWQKGDLASVWQDADRAAPGSAQAQGLRSLLSTARGVGAAPPSGSGPGAAAVWEGFVRGSLQQSARTAPVGDQDGSDALLLGRLGRRAPDWSADYTYFVDISRSQTGTARVDYHGLALQWSPPGSDWNLRLDEAAEWSQGQLAYDHHLAELRRTWGAWGAWRGWTGLQALWENYPGIAELDAFGPSLAAGMAGPVAWGGVLALDLRLRGDDTQSWADRDAAWGFHGAVVWRSGLDFSPRLDLDAKTQAYPDWPGSPGRWDQSLDGRFELVLWQDLHGQVSLGDEAWNHASTVSDYRELGNSVFAAGTIFW